MAESFTSYSIENDEKFRAWLKRASEAVDDLRVPFGLILRDFYRSEQAIFKLKGPGKYPAFKGSSGEVTSLGGKNNPYGRKRTQTAVNKSPYQLAKIKAVGFDYPLLVRSGALAASLLGPSNKGSIANIGPLHLYFGTSIEYGIYHQSDRERKKIPLRKFLFIGPEASRFATSDQMGRLERWLNIMNDYVLKKTKPEST